MLEQVESIFDEMPAMLKNLTKVSYKQNMDKFRENNERYFREMVTYVAAEEDKKAAFKQVSQLVIAAVIEKFGKSGKVKRRTLTDLNLFMIYYVFPAILLMNQEVSEQVAEHLKEEWNLSFKGCSIGFTTYDSLYNSFNEKLLGIF